MKEKKIIYPIIFLAIIAPLNLYYMWNTERRSYAMRQCEYQLASVALSAKLQVDRKLKEIENLVINSKNAKILEISDENLKLKLQNEELINKIIKMFGLLRGEETLLNESFGKTNI